MVALGALGVSLGLGGTVVAINYVQASDRVDMYEIMRADAAARAPRARPVATLPSAYTAHTAQAYAPARPPTVQPLGQVNQRGQIQFPQFPAFNLNPFQPMGPDPRAQVQQRPRNGAVRAAQVQQAALFDGGGHPDTVSGSSDQARTICVRLCDGYQYPLANLRDGADVRAHEALCSAMFPGVPTRVFRVAGGAITIDEALGPDGKTYRSLPMAYAFQRSIDPACARPRTGDSTISLYRDFTLRPGDSVVTQRNGVRVFTGGSSYPFTSANFRDFRNSRTVTAQTRRSIDDRVGVSQRERQEREVRAMSRVREASANDANRAVDVIRGGPTLERGEVRVIDIGRR